MFKKIIYRIGISALVLLIVPISLYASQSDNKTEENNTQELTQQVEALVEDEVNQVLFLAPQDVPARRCSSSNCDRYGVGSLEVVAGVGAFAKGIAFAATETDDKSRGEAGVVLVSDILIGLFLIVDGLFRLFPRK